MAYCPSACSRLYRRDDTRCSKLVDVWPTGCWALPTPGNEMLAPELRAGEPGALGQRLELGPDDRGMAHALAQPAVGPADHVLAPHQPREADQPLGHQLRVLDEVAGVAHHTGDEQLALREPHVLPDPPLMLVARVRRLDRVGLGGHAEDQVDDVAEGDVVLMG